MGFLRRWIRSYRGAQKATCGSGELPNSQSRLCASRQIKHNFFDVHFFYSSRDPGSAVSRSDTGDLEKSRLVFGAIGSNTR